MLGRNTRLNHVIGPVQQTKSLTGDDLDLYDRDRTQYDHWDLESKFLKLYHSGIDPIYVVKQVADGHLPAFRTPHLNHVAINIDVIDL